MYLFLYFNPVICSLRQWIPLLPARTRVRPGQSGNFRVYSIKSYIRNGDGSWNCSPNLFMDHHHTGPAFLGEPGSIQSHCAVPAQHHRTRAVPGSQISAHVGNGARPFPHYRDLADLFPRNFCSQFTSYTGNEVAMTCN